MIFMKKHIKQIILLILIWIPFFFVYLRFPNQIYDAKKSIYIDNPVQLSLSKIKVTYPTGIINNQTIDKDSYTISTYPFYGCALLATILVFYKRNNEKG